MAVTGPRNAIPALRAAAFAVAALLAGCSPGSDAPTATPSWSADDPATITSQRCSGVGSCALGFYFDEVYVEVNCRGITKALSDEVIAIGSEGVEVSEARAVSGVSPHLLVAVRNAPGICDGGADWVAGIVYSAERTIEEKLELSVAICEVAEAPYTYPYLDTHDCEQGGPAELSFEGSDGTSGTDYAWFPSVVAETNEALEAGEGPPHRRDPAAAVVAFEQWQFPACFTQDPSSHLQVCRIARGVIPTDPEGKVTVSGLSQTRNADIGYDSQSFEWTVEQLGGGPGWWVTRKTYRPMSNLSDNAADRIWEQCCTEAITHIDNRM